MSAVMGVTAPGSDELLFRSLTAQEELSRLFEYQAELLSTSEKVALDDLIGKMITVKLQVAKEGTRFFNGYVTSISYHGGHGRYHSYSVVLHPWLWFLTRTADCRVFQDLTVPDIVKQVFADYDTADFEFHLSGSYRTWNYCVQYRETAFNFVSRLLEHEGIYYYFKHDEGRCTMIITDSYSGHAAYKNYESVPYVSAGGAIRPEVEYVSFWQVTRSLQPGVYVHDDYDMTRPDVELKSSKALVRDHAEANYEIYDYPGTYLQKSDGDQYADVRVGELAVQFETAHGNSNARGICAGSLLNLTDHPRSDQNREYLITGITYHLEYAGYESTGGGTSCNCRFVAIPSHQQYRPLRLTPKPFVQGSQTAVVVGPSANEIYTESKGTGRVKVQFFWDRRGEFNEDSSCWVRVSQPWAGKNWGAINIPRIGQEVLVDFLEGDPDQPIIIGRLYNAAQMPPYSMPDNMTRTTFMTRSTQNGNGSNYNELRFEDKIGSEQIFINAEKDMDQRVENDSREYVTGDRSLIVKANQRELVNADKHGHVKGSHFEKIEGDMSFNVGGKQMVQTGGDQSINIGGDQKEQVTGSMSLKVGQDQKEQIGGSVSLQIGASRNESVGQTHAMQAGQTIHLKGGMTVVIEAGMQLSLKGPGGFVDIGPAGVTIQGTMVLINSGGAAANGPGANTQSPASPDAPKDPKDPDTADDGSKGGKL